MRLWTVLVVGVLVLLVVPGAHAATSNKTTTSLPSRVSTKDTPLYVFADPTQTTLAVLLLATGPYLLFAGRRYFFAMCALNGAYAFALLSYIALSSVESAVLYANRDLVYIVTMVVCALAGAAVSWKYWTVGFPSVGMLFGFLLSLWIMSWADGGLVKGNINGDPTTPFRFLLEIGLGILFYIMIFYHDRYICSFGTAFIGSFAIAVGADFFIKSGFKSAVAFFLGGVNSPLTFKTSPTLFIILGGIIGGCVIGGLVQIFVTAPLKLDYDNKFDNDIDDDLVRNNSLHMKPVRMGIP